LRIDIIPNPIKHHKLACVFDIDKSVVERVCRQSESRLNFPSAFIKDTLDLSRHINSDELDICEKFFKQLIGLKRKDYKIIVNCLTAYNASIRLLTEDIGLAYSMLVYCLDSLSQGYENYRPSWEDYDQDKKSSLEKIFGNLPDEISLDIKNILIQDEQFKLSQRFKNFIVKYLDNDYYHKKDERNIVKKDDVEIALANAYIIRSKYVHILQPVTDLLTIAGLSKNNDTFQNQHNIYFTYGGLLRTVRTVINNLIFSFETVNSETINWHDELPGIIKVDVAPQYWIWQPDSKSGEGAIKRLEGFLTCYIRKNVPDMNDVIKLYFKHLYEMKEENRHAAFALGYLYGKAMKGIDEDSKKFFEQYIMKHIELLDKCCIYNILLLVMPISITREVLWDTDVCAKIVLEYNKKKHKHNKIKLPWEIETMIYLVIAYGFKEESSEKYNEWIWKAYYNSNNEIKIQTKIKECINNKKILPDISFIWDIIDARLKKEEWEMAKP